jgi:hypothetical protein
MKMVLETVRNTINSNPNNNNHNPTMNLLSEDPPVPSTAPETTAISPASRPAATYNPIELHSSPALECLRTSNLTMMAGA